MPLVRVEMLKGKSTEYKKTVLDCIHEGLAEALGVEGWDRFQRIIEFPSFKSENFMIIELVLFPGRTKEQKAAAIETITAKLAERLAIDKEDVFIVISEPPLENWGIGGRQK